MKQFKVKSSTLKKGFFCLFVPAVFLTTHLNAQLTGFTYGKTITIQGSQISGTLANFPVLISLTDNSLRTTGNGGRVQNANGYDIVFTLPDCSTILPMQVEKYTASSGQLVAWVRLPSLVSGNNQIIYMFYGKTGVVTNPSSSTVWDANYMGVWHFNNTVTDGTANGRTLTDNNTANTTLNSKIGDCRRLANTPNITSGTAGVRYLRLPNNMFNGVNDFTFEGWVFLESINTNWERIFDFGRSTTYNMFLTPSIEGNGVKRFAITTNGNGSEQQISSGATTTTGTWHHFAVTINSGTNTGILYYDGVSNATNNGMTLSPGDLGTTNQNYFGISQYTGDHGLYGNFDEFRISNSVRSADWIRTSYRNQNTPASFYTVGSEVVGGALCTVLPLQITSFEARPAQDGTVTIRWVAEQETSSDKYILERSANGTNWDAIKTISAMGNGSVQKYVTQDPTPLYPVSYYRLQQVGAGSSITYTQAVSAKMDEVINNTFIASPNPARQSINLTFRENALPQNISVELLSNMGVRVLVKPEYNGNTISMKLPVLSNGIYFLNVYIKGTKHSRKILIVQ